MYSQIRRTNKILDQDGRTHFIQLCKRGDDFPLALREGKTAMIIEESAVCCTMVLQLLSQARNESLRQTLDVTLSLLFSSITRTQCKRYLFGLYILLGIRLPQNFAKVDLIIYGLFVT